MPASTTPVVRAARPSFRVGGEDRPRLALGLLEMSISESIAGLYRCEASFGNWGTVGNSTSFLYFARDVLDFGKQFVVSVDDRTLFEGVIVALEADFPEGEPPRITVLADDRLQDLRMTRRTRSWENVTDASVLNTIAQDHGLNADVNLQGPTHTALAQVNQSDLAFARERVRLGGGELWVEGGKFIVKARPSRASGSALELSHGAALRSFSVCADLAHQRSKVAVTGWNVANKEGVKHETTASILGNEASGGDSGASILGSALGERAETVVHTAARDASSAEAFANAYFRSIARRFIVGRGVADGDARLRVGSTVEIKGVGALFSGTYAVVETRHSFSSESGPAGGYRTELTVERPALGRN